jgi:hypothetical protein
MALRARYEQNFRGVRLKSGRMYTFAYTGFQHDPAPLIIFLYWMEGTHPTTKRQWRFIQAINLNYLSRSYRKHFVDTWSQTLYTTRNIKMTWNKLSNMFPEMKFATRRYFYSPAYYIKNIRAIETQDVEKEVVGSLYKDFSRKARIAFWTQIRKLQAHIPTILGGHVNP